MANLTAAREDNRQDDKLRLVKLGAVQVFKGSIVTKNTSGYAVKGADTAGFTFSGIAFESIDNSAGAAGDLTARVWTEGSFELDFSGTATQADEGKKVYAVDDHTVGLAATTTNDVLVGVISEYVSATKVRVAITPNA
jgi:hypothetical protein